MKLHETRLGRRKNDNVGLHSARCTGKMRQCACNDRFGGWGETLKEEEMESAHIPGGRGLGVTKLMLGAAAAGCLIAAGCVIEPAPRRVYYATPPPPPGAVVVEPAPPAGEVVAAEAPPAPIVEVQPVVPVAIVDPFWIPGWWAWEGRWVWHGGYWAHRPHRGAVWVPHGWVHGPRGWVYSPGHWR